MGAQSYNTTKSSSKPRCKLPELCTSSYLIGNTVFALRDAGRERDVAEFLSRLKPYEDEINFSIVLEVAVDYVEFYD
ncbi:MAG TPA: hypothetical protein PKM65_15195 [Spirochaetota bacterium]|nr:hypothetical protein [Spirochaetota bacterium]HNT10420.1 hypothetical protein [Spirochaetota bacterium]HOS41695.1 hypothetical protein [Spirochaetota bacterium]